MLRLIVAITCVTSILIAPVGASSHDTTIDISIKNSSIKYDTDFDIGYKYKQSTLFELDTRATYSNSTQSKAVGSALSVDLFPEYEWSPFSFVHYSNKESNSYMYEYQRIGAGLSWVPGILSNRHQFPFKHKLSLANIYETGKGTHLSYRYKLYMDLSKYISVKFTFFLLEYAQTSDLSIKYKLSKHIRLSYKAYRESFSKDGKISDYYKTQLMIGVEYKLGEKK